MALKPAICTQCGGQIKVDDSREAGICEFCGTPFITEKVINKYITQNNFAGATFNIQNGVDAENLYKLARRALETENVDDILKYYGQLRERFPDDWEASFYYAFYSNGSENEISFAIRRLYDADITHEELLQHIEEIKAIMKKIEKKNRYTTTTDASLSYAPVEVFYKGFFDKLEKNNNKLNYNLVELFDKSLSEYPDYFYCKIIKINEFISAFEKIYLLPIEDERKIETEIYLTKIILKLAKNKVWFLSCDLSIKELHRNIIYFDDFGKLIDKCTYWKDESGSISQNQLKIKIYEYYRNYYCNKKEKKIITKIIDAYKISNEEGIKVEQEAIENQQTVIKKQHKKENHKKH